MELRKSRRLLVFSAFLLAIGVLVLLGGSAASSSPSVGALLFGGITALLGGVFVVSELKPFRFLIGPEGLTLRVAGLNRLVPWAEIDAIVLDESVPSPGGSKPASPSLLLVPAAGSTIDRPLTARSPVDERASLTLLDLDRVRQPADEVAAALARFGGGRFTDVRRLRRERFDSPNFAIGLRGYDPARVDELIRRGQDALISGRTLQRYQVKAELDEARTDLPRATRGYDCGQVDALLEELSAVLATWGGEGAKAE
ncbi:hypothetical protein AB0B83_01635 [Micromonospora sp. NPDC049060]|uniref:hypothetical protein n=1 Tax=Micromonospora sp. NPDC049060 TaxID=3154828 RepID=UPI0033D21244